MGGRSGRRALISGARRWWYRTLEATSPAVFCWWNRRFPDRFVVGSSTDLVIEGYPGASNSWAREVFNQTQPGIGIASHLHSSAHVRRALKLGLPTLVLLRPPVPSVASLLSRYPERDLDPRAELARYLRFYRAVERRADRLALVTFDDAVSRPETLILAVNQRFGTALRPVGVAVETLQSSVLAVLDHSSRVVAGDLYEIVTPRPSAARKAAAASARARVENSDPALLAACDALYAALAATASARQAAASGG